MRLEVVELLHLHRSQEHVIAALANKYRRILSQILTPVSESISEAQHPPCTFPNPLPKGPALQQTFGIPLFDLFPGLRSRFDAHALMPLSSCISSHDAGPVGSTGLVYVTFSTATFSVPLASFLNW